MTRFALFALALIAFSCGSKDSEESTSSNILEDISFTVDTVVVDPGEELINLAWGLRLSALTEDKEKLFLFNEVDQTLSEIDLEELKLLRKIKFEKEGPNGIGEYLWDVHILPGTRFLFSSYDNRGIYSESGQKLDELKIPVDAIEGMNPDDESGLWNGLLISSDEKFLFSLPGNFFEGTQSSARMDLGTKTGKIIEIPAMDFASQFRIILRSAEMMSVFVEEISIQELNSKLIIQTTAGSDAYLFESTSDSLGLLTFDHKLVPKKKEATVRNEVTSQKEFEDEMAKLSSQIGFEKFI
jgi:hypothetical protein